MNNMNKIIRGILYAVLSFAVIAGVEYTVAGFRNVPLDLDWFWISVEAAALGVIFVFGPDAAQRKKNRENLVKHFTGK